MNTDTTKAATPEPATPKLCTCLADTNTKLKLDGYKLDDRMQALRMTGTALTHGWLLPATKLDGKRKKRGDLGGVWINFCPFCGLSLNPVVPESKG